MATIDGAFANPEIQGTNYPTVIAQDNAAQGKGTKVPTYPARRALDGVVSRAEHVQRLMDAGFPLTDEALIQQRNDCRELMEAAHSRHCKTGCESTRDEADLWLARFYKAIRALSPQWKAAREAQIQADIGAGFFIEQGEKAREQIAANEGRNA
jgi:hypothetical protein